MEREDKLALLAQLRRLVGCCNAETSWQVANLVVVEYEREVVVLGEDVVAEAH